jgi:hypothetical protein
VLWVLVIVIPITLMWAFALVDLFRRDDLPGWGKAIWLVVVIVFPVVGSVVYLFLRPVGATPEERRALAATASDMDTHTSASDLSALSELHDRGKLTDSEFAAAKARIIPT